MSEFGNHIKQFSAADIQRYLDGRMNVAEMHAIEKAALDDPFLADAIEGIESAKKEYSNDAINNDIDQLRKQIAQKVNTGRVIHPVSFRWWRVAAAAVIIIICGALAYTTWLKPELKQESIAINKPATESNETISAAPDQITAKPADSLTFRISSDETKESTAPVLTREKKSNLSNKESEDGKASGPVTIRRENKNQVAPPVVESEVLAEGAKNVELKDVAKGQRRDTAASPQAASRKQPEKADDKEADAAKAEEIVIVNDVSKKSKDKSANKGNEVGIIKGTSPGINSNAGLNFFNGRVVDLNNRPVANATVQLENTRSGYRTDQYGNFKFPSTDTQVNVMISVVGFNSQTFRLRNDVAINQVQLQPANNSLSEVVVTSPQKNAAKQKTGYKTKYPTVLVQDAEPVTGWIEFDKYIDSNKKSFTEPAAKTGEVVVSFQVNRKSELSDFKIEQRLSVVQDAEAIRLIKEGPSWRSFLNKSGLSPFSIIAILSIF